MPVWSAKPYDLFPVACLQAAMLCVLFAFMHGSAAQLDGESSLSKDMPSLATLHSLVDDVENSDTDVKHA